MCCWGIRRGKDALYGDDFGGDESGLPITTFQSHGVNRAEQIIEKYGGVLIADGVGLWKTFTAGEIIRKYREKRQRVLLVCPATLRDGSWKEFQDRFDLRFETVSYEELAGDDHLGGTKKVLGSDLNDYQLVVIDESHNYRNPDAPKRARAEGRRAALGHAREQFALGPVPPAGLLPEIRRGPRGPRRAEPA